jgi:rod shape determining protein RodA
MDKSLFFLYLALVIMGLSTVYSSSYNSDFPSIFNWKEEYGKQFIWICISLLIGFFILLLEGNFIRNSAYLVYGVVILLLFVVLFMPAIKGAHSWFKIGSFTIQPAEFAKFATALALARFLSTTGVKIASFSTKIKTFYFLIVPLVLIVLEPDPGTGLVFLSFILVLYREGMSGNFLLAGLFMVVLAVISIYIATFEDVQGNANAWNGILIFASATLVVGGLTMLIVRMFIMPRYRMIYFLPTIYSTVCGVLLIFTVYWAYNNVFQDRHKDRFQNLFGLKIDRQGTGYNIYQALSAIGSGETMGKGYMKGTLSNDEFKHVPEQSTDFIFCSWAEERGFAGSLVLVVVYISFLIRIIIVAERQRSVFTRIFAYSVSSIMFFHFMINIAMVLGLAPVIGIPLPFFSKGGSAILGFSIMVFIVLRLDAERKDVLR